MGEKLNREGEPQQNQPEIMEKQQPSLGQILEYSQFKADRTQQDLEENPNNKTKQRVANQWSGARDVIYEVALKNKDRVTSTEDLRTALERYQDWLDKKVTADDNEYKQIKLQKVKFSDAQGLIENFNFHNLESPFFKEWKSKKDKEAESKKQESQTVEKAKTEQEIKEEKLILEILTDGGVGVYTSLPPKYHPRGDAGYTSIEDNRLVPYAPGNFDPSAERGFFNLTTRERAMQYKEANCREFVGFLPVTADIFEEVPVQEKRMGGIFGAKTVMKNQKTGTRPVLHSESVKNGKNEPLVKLMYRVESQNEADFNLWYHDYTTRGGQVFGMEVLLSQSLEKKIEQEIKSNPTFIRKIAGEMMIKKLGIPEKTWNEGDEYTHHPLRPPYEKWDKAGEAIYIKEPDDQIEYDGSYSRLNPLKPERIFPVKPKK